ncbi:amidohydrolase family protein [Actinomycetospora flava]|uniref:Amidohydrolase family protein n=1 Tax=Actinomycetospora flava TaxID=3129232 RepID=A0ABU8M4C4_9PSEU
MLRDGVIDDIAPAESVTPVGDVVEGHEHSLIPGLIDTHVHLTDQGELEATARAGVTTVVELGTHPDELIDELRREAPRGRGSDVVSAGSAASAPGSTQTTAMGFPIESAVTDPGDAERYLSWRVDHGSDLIKIIVEDPDATDVPALSPETLAALVDGAHRRGLLTVAHVVTAQSFARALHAGVDVLTHAPLDRVLPPGVLEDMLAAGVVVSPTLVMMRTVTRARLGARAEEAFATCLQAVREMYRAGVPIVAGTDANNTPFAPVAHGSSLHEELGWLRQAGMTAREALNAATGRAAQTFRLTDRGEVAVGQRADLLLVRGAINTDLDTLADPAGVWLAGSRLV